MPWRTQPSKVRVGRGEKISAMGRGLVAFPFGDADAFFVAADFHVFADLIFELLAARDGLEGDQRVHGVVGGELQITQAKKTQGEGFHEHVVADAVEFHLIGAFGKNPLANGEPLGRNQVMAAFYLEGAMQGKKKGKHRQGPYNKGDNRAGVLAQENRQAKQNAKEEAAEEKNGQIEDL